MLKKWSGRVKQGVFCALLAFVITPVFALTYDLPANGDDIVGNTEIKNVEMGDNLSTFAERYDAGYYELLEANPRLNPLRMSAGMRLVIPHQFILPDAPRAGIVINLAELRLFYYPPGTNKVIIYPIGIGRVGNSAQWQTPTGQLSVIQKKANPEWRAPPSVVADMAKRGITIPEVIPPGPDNPLGAYMMRLSNWSYLIHGTNRPSGVGRRTSAGCIRMYPEDVEALFALVPVGTKVTIVNQPFKAGWLNNQFYFEAHTPLREQRIEYAGQYDSLWNQAINDAAAKRAARVDWDTIHKLAQKQTGVAEVVGTAVAQPEAAIAGQPAGIAATADLATAIAINEMDNKTAS